MIAEVLGRLVAALLPVVLPEVGAATLLVVAAVALVALVAAVLRLGADVTSTRRAARRFAEVRVLLRASDPDAAGHRRARAPGAAA